MLSIGDRMATNHLRECDNGAGISDNSTEVGDDTAGIINIVTKVIPC